MLIEWSDKSQMNKYKCPTYMKYVQSQSLWEKDISRDIMISSYSNQDLFKTTTVTNAYADVVKENPCTLLVGL